jgi:hypothetical protein
LLSETGKLKLTRRRNPMLLKNLTLEEVGLTFQVLAEQLPIQKLPDHLQMLDEDQWEELAFLLDSLWLAKELSSLH